jgi:transcriptional regulator with XRE-family HTH domain
MSAAAPKPHPLTRYRQRHTLTLSAFALLVGASPATVSRIESGSRQPGLTLLRQIVAACQGEVTADEIVHYRSTNTDCTAA